MVKSKKRAQQLLFIGLIISLGLVIYSLMSRPVAKTEKINYILGQEVPLQASIYLNHVSDTDQVSIDVSQFQVQEAVEKQVTVAYNGENYKVIINFIAPNIKELIKVSERIQDFVISGNYQAVFGIDDKYLKDVKFSVPSENLKLGEQTVTATLYGQSVSQKLYVYDASNDMGKLAKAYDYAKQDLVTVVQNYLADEQLQRNQVAFSYINTATHQSVQMNENQQMPIGNTYQLPLALFVEDELKTRGYTKDSLVLGESVASLFEQSISQSSRIATEKLENYFGMGTTLYQNKLKAYGENQQASIKTVDMISNQTTANYAVQVLEHLWKNKEQYPLVLEQLKQTNPNLYYEMYLQKVDIWHKGGIGENSINDLAIVYERTPYVIALYTNQLTEYQFGKLAYVINEWHRINQDKHE